jgi:polyisoprenoid-binding protein YceI
MSVGQLEIPSYVTGTWTIDPAHSDVGFAIRHLMITNVKGHFTRFEGRIVTAEDPLRSTATPTIDMASIDTAQPIRDEHLRSAEFFDVDEHPTMTHRSTGIRRDGAGYVMDGELTLKGVIQPVALAPEVNGFGVDPYAPDPATGARAGFTATGEINRTDFGIDYNGPVPGGVLLSEKVTIVLEIEAALVRA